MFSWLSIFKSSSWRENVKYLFCSALCPASRPSIFERNRKPTFSHLTKTASAQYTISLDLKDDVNDIIKPQSGNIIAELQQNQNI